MNRIYELRKQNGLSQQKLAEILNVHQTAVSQWEKGRTNPDMSILQAMSKYFKVSIDYILNNNSTQEKQGIHIPVLGRVAAGVPITAAENIIDYEEIEEELSKTGEFFALKIHGSSMEPRFCKGDVVIVRQQSDVDSGNIAIVLINGEDATCKKVIKQTDGIMLVSINSNYAPMYYTNKEIETLPVKILGKVIELRAKF